MSAGNINFILHLWATSLAIHDDEPPFLTAARMYNTNDSISLGNVAWKSFSLQYNGIKPAGGNVPSWMEAECDV